MRARLSPGQRRTEGRARRAGVAVLMAIAGLGAGCDGTRTAENSTGPTSATTEGRTEERAAGGGEGNDGWNDDSEVGTLGIEACDLTDPSTAEAALGGAVTKPVAGTGGGADDLAGRSGCAWTTVDESGAVLIELVRTDDMSDSVRRTGFSASARFGAARSRHHDVPLGEIGDASFWVEEAATLYVLSGRSYLVIEVAVPFPDRSRAVAEQLAAAAVSRLAAAGGQTDSDDE